jgi:hypothetical protein
MLKVEKLACIRSLSVLHQLDFNKFNMNNLGFQHMYTYKLAKLHILCFSFVAAGKVVG